MAEAVFPSTASAAAPGAAQGFSAPSVSPYWYQRTLTRWREFVQRLGLQELPPPAGVSPVLSATDVRQLAVVGHQVLPQQLELWLDQRYRQNGEGPGYALFYQSYSLNSAGHLHVTPKLSMVWRYDAMKKQDMLNNISQIIDLNEKLKDKNTTFITEAGLAHPAHWGYSNAPALVHQLRYHHQDAVYVSELSRQPEQLRQQFYAAQDGLFALDLYDKFGREQVEQELEGYLSTSFFPRLSLTADLLTLTQLRQHSNASVQDETSVTPTRQIKAERVVTIS